MKIVFLADAPYIHTRRWVEDSISRGNETHVISFRPSEIPGATVHHIAGAERTGKARYLINAPRIRSLIKKLKPDLVHALHLTSYGFLAALAGCHPLVTSVWGTDILEAPQLEPFHNWITRKALAEADVITATSLGLATATTRYAPRGAAVEVVPYGVNTSVFRPGPRVGRTPVRIGSAARLSEEKGIDVLLQAFAALIQKHPSRVELHIAGEGPEESKLRSLAQELSIGESVRFLGWLDHDDLPGFLQELDFFALPSRFEGFGVAAAEAASMELPVVASDVHGVPDVVLDGKNGLLVPAENPEALAAALSRLVEDSELRLRLGQEGRRGVLAHYDWADNTAQMDRTYARVLARSGAGA